MHLQCFFFPFSVFTLSLLKKSLSEKERHNIWSLLKHEDETQFLSSKSISLRFWTLLFTNTHRLSLKESEANYCFSSFVYKRRDQTIFRIRRRDESEWKRKSQREWTPCYFWLELREIRVLNIAKRVEEEREGGIEKEMQQTEKKKEWKHRETHVQKQRVEKD